MDGYTDYFSYMGYIPKDIVKMVIFKLYNTYVPAGYVPRIPILEEA